MSMTFLLVTGVVGLGIGIWLGMPGRYTQTPEDIERIMESGGARRRRTKRVFTPLAWVQRHLSARQASQDRRRGRSGFKLKAPDELE